MGEMADDIIDRFCFFYPDWIDEYEETYPMEEYCPHCGGDMVTKPGRRGPFRGCSNYPKCDYTESFQPYAEITDFNNTRRNKRMANLATQQASTKVVTNKVRFSYAYVWEPTAISEGQDPKYSVSVLIPKTDKATIAKIHAAVDAAIEAGKTKLGDKNGKVNKAALKLPLRDGDIDRPDDEAYAGCYFLNANSKTAPGIVDAARNAILDKSEFYSGCYGRASVNFYAFNNSGNKGIACGLQNLQKLADGEALAGRSSAEDDFAEDYEDDDLLG